MRKQTTNEQKEAAWIEFIGRHTEPVQLELEIDGIVSDKNILMTM
jgi:hypothetical protein